LPNHGISIVSARHRAVGFTVDMPAALIKSKSVFSGLGGPLLLALVVILIGKAVQTAAGTRRAMSLRSIQAAVVGLGRHEILRKLGAPRAASRGTTTIWYYPLHAGDRLAMAIAFDNERAASVEFIPAPTDPRTK